MITIWSRKQKKQSKGDKEEWELYNFILQWLKDINWDKKHCFWPLTTMISI
jgi:hypothetical protein